MCFCHRVTPPITSKSVISVWGLVTAYLIIMVNNLRVYLAWIYILFLPLFLSVLPLSMILFVSQCLANFALGCNLGTQENAPRLHNLVSGARVVIQLQWEMPRGVNPLSGAVKMKSPLNPEPFRFNELFQQIALHRERTLSAVHYKVNGNG